MNMSFFTRKNGRMVRLGLSENGVYHLKGLQI